MLPHGDLAVRTLLEVDEDMEDRTCHFDSGRMDCQCGHCQAFQ